MARPVDKPSSRAHLQPFNGLLQSQWQAHLREHVGDELLHDAVLLIVLRATRALCGCREEDTSVPHEKSVAPKPKSLKLYNKASTRSHAGHPKLSLKYFESQTSKSQGSPQVPTRMVAARRRPPRPGAAPEVTGSHPGIAFPKEARLCRCELWSKTPQIEPRG